MGWIPFGWEMKGKVSRMPDHQRVETLKSPCPLKHGSVALSVTFHLLSNALCHPTERCEQSSTTYECQIVFRFWFSSFLVDPDLPARFSTFDFGTLDITQPVQRQTFTKDHSLPKRPNFPHAGRCHRRLKDGGHGVLNDNREIIYIIYYLRSYIYIIYMKGNMP